MSSTPPLFTSILPETPPPLAAIPIQLALNAVSPPTPAPSPRPTDHARFPSSSTTHAQPDLLLQRIRAEFHSLPLGHRQKLLESLILDASPSLLSHLLPLIIPRLKRDFLRTLPLELAFHVLCFVDDVRTLARASGVSRFWRGLLEDEGTWKRMCWKSGFGEDNELLSLGGEDIISHGERMRSLEFGRREEEIGTPAGRERRGTLDRDELLEFAARAELFGLRSVVEEASTRRGSRSHERDWDRTEERDEEQIAAWGPWENSGLGFGGGLLAAGADRAGRDSSAERRERMQASRRERTNETDLPLPATPQQPLSFSLHTDEDPLISPRRTRHHSLPPPPHATDDTEEHRTTLLPAYRSPNSSSRPLSSLFDLDLTLAPHPDDDPSFHHPTSSTKKPFSYKTHFKRAYLTESSWLRGPGRLLSTQMSTDDGVVTSLGVDDEWIVVGMATAKLHVFDSEGAYVKTLDGHELGVWCLTLVSKGGGVRDGKGKDRAEEEDDEEIEERIFASTSAAARARGGRASGQFTNDSPVAHSPFFRHSRPSDPVSPTTTSPSPITSFPSPLPPSATAPSAPAPPPLRRRRKSFHAFGAAFDTASTNGSAGGREKERTGGMGLGAGGPTGDSSQQAGVCGTARGWGRKGATVVSGGCDRDVRVWDIESGTCLHVLRGHTSTVRCLRVIDGRPIAVSGSRDATLRVWDIEKGIQLHLLAGHENSVRCIEVAGNKVVSGSYDATCRLWDVDTGECLFVYRGHFHQIYAVAFDGLRIVTGSLDSTVRVWSAVTGESIALLQGHTSLVGQLQMDPISNVLVTGGSDGRVIVFSLTTYETLHRLCAHDNSVTCLQFDDRFIVTGGNDGRTKLWDFRTGAFIRELGESCEAVWRVVFRDDRCVVLCRREGRTVMEVKSFRPSAAELFGEEGEGVNAGR